jgi:hypothetical protein
VPPKARKQLLVMNAQEPEHWTLRTEVPRALELDADEEDDLHEDDWDADGDAAEPVCVAVTRYRVHRDGSRLFGPGRVADLVLLAVPKGARAADGVIIERVETPDARRTGRALLRDLRGTHPAHGRLRFLRERLQLIERDRGPCDLAIAVRYGVRARRTSPVKFATAAMLAKVLAAGVSFGGFRWHASRRPGDDLPEAPHDPIRLVVVGVDHTGKIHTNLPGGTTGRFDRWHGRNARAVFQAFKGSDGYPQVKQYCEAHGLVLIGAWREE